MKQFKHTRIAPTPSGFLHMGNIASFAITYALAKKYGVDVLLRIDDMDKARAAPIYVDDIFSTLKFLGLQWQRGPANSSQFNAEYSQQHRLPAYNYALTQLRDAGLLYACNCSRAQLARHVQYPGTCRHKNLPFDFPQVNWRLRTDDEPMAINSLNGIVQASLPADMRDFVVRKKDGLPAYQLASVIDDMHFNVDLIVRGQDLWHSTLAQVYLAQKLKLTTFTHATFYHHQLFTNGQGQKLSKSAGANAVSFTQQGLSVQQLLSVVGNRLGLSVEFSNWQQLANALQQQV